jgi:O-antigen ligase
VNDESGVKSILPILFWCLPTLAALVFLLYLRPALFRDPIILGALILFEIVLASLWHYQKLYFPLTMITFVLGGADVPFAGAALSARWLVLGVGALAGAAIWMRGRRQSFSLLHLVAFLCVPAATVSAIDSNDPRTALLKVASLFLLFLYCSTGIRFAILGREADFMRGLLLGCEITVFGTGLSYAAGWAFWYNPNSLGAVIGVAMTPFILWGFLIAETRGDKYRRGIGLLICLILLFVSLSRASIMAATITSIAVCICLRRQRLLIEGAFLLVLILAVAAVIEPARFEQFSSNLTTDILYKGKKEQGVFGSRQSPWQDTVASLKRHPWFGTGFGTSDVGSKGTQVTKLSVMEGIYTNEGTNREHGNSYLALAEYLGILGMIPFAFLLLLLVRMIVQVCMWMRRIGDPRHYAVPLSMVLLGGLVHVFFEDWLLAVGYYLCIFFWVCAFLLEDLLPERRSLHLAAASPAHPRSFALTSAPIASP